MARYQCFRHFGEAFDGGTVSLLHWALTDATMVMEYDHGVLKTYQSP